MYRMATYGAFDYRNGFSWRSILFELKSGAQGILAWRCFGFEGTLDGVLVVRVSSRLKNGLVYLRLPPDLLGWICVRSQYSVIDINPILHNTMYLGTHRRSYLCL